MKGREGESAADRLRRERAVEDAREYLEREGMPAGEEADDEEAMHKSLSRGNLERGCCPVLRDEKDQSLVQYMCEYEGLRDGEPCTRCGWYGREDAQERSDPVQDVPSITRVVDLSGLPACEPAERAFSMDQMAALAKERERYRLALYDSTNKATGALREVVEAQKAVERVRQDLAASRQQGRNQADKIDRLERANTEQARQLIDWFHKASRPRWLVWEACRVWWGRTRKRVV